MGIFKRIIFVLLVFPFVNEIFSQDVPKNVIVEHFTNTRCSACASRNPNFYNALKPNPNVIHIAFHPSAPYSACIFSTQNKVQNDARPKFYGIFGSTPRFVINGTELPGSQVVNSTVYNEFNNQTTPVDLQVKVAKAGTDIEVSFNVNIKSNNTIGSVNYLVALVEDTVFYNAPNGEKIHRDVFRRSFSNDALPSFMVPQNAGNQYNFKGAFKTETFWDLSRIYAIVILTDSNKEVVQVAKSPLYNPNIVSSTDQQLELVQNVNIYPNPVTSELYIQSYSNESIQNIMIKNSIGQKVMEIAPKVAEASINVSHLTQGAYLLELSFENSKSIQKFIKI